MSAVLLRWCSNTALVVKGIGELIAGLVMIVVMYLMMAAIVIGGVMLAWPILKALVNWVSYWAAGGPS